LADSRGNAVAGHGADGTYVSPSVAVTGAAGTASLDLEPNADITPTGTQYTVYMGDLSFKITKSADTQTLLEALTDPVI